jgi:hypothetical protein
MSMIKRWIDQQKDEGNDPFDNQDENFSDDEFRYDEWCHYSALPSPTYYNGSDFDDAENEDVE